MGLISIALLVILVISAILLVLVVLVQDEQGEGIGGIFGGGSSTAFGSRSGNVLTRFTAVLAAIFLFCCFGVAWINRTPNAGNVIGKSRQQALTTTSDQNSWWVQSSPTGTTTGTTPGTSAQTPAAPSTSTGTSSTNATTGASSSAGSSSSTGSSGQPTPSGQGGS